MNWEIDYLEEDNIVQVKTNGHLRWEDKKKLSQETLAAGREKNARAFLIDHKDATFALSVLEIDKLPDMFKALGFGPEDKMAILFSSDSAKNSLFKFFQNVFYLNSLQIRVFTDPNEATAWLKAK